MKRIATLCLAALYTTACLADDFYVKGLTFPDGISDAEKIEMASRVVPSDKQLAWQANELTAFLHFGMNTFTDREWGDGTESPSIFNPDALDAEQWVRTLHDAGFKMVILTAKHHDGFCLWPTATTDHSVKNSPWRDGKGDVVRELRDACTKYGMKMGVYLSPWDRNAECYGDSPRYNDMFVAQLTELLTNYGKIDEVWFDGACGEGPNGKKQVYDWLRFRQVMTTLQPDAVLAITGDDVRWVGNESGLGRETEWSVTPLTPGIYTYADSANNALGIDAMSKDIGSREQIAKASKLYWWPSEVDVSIRPGWFYHENEKPHSLAHLADIYLKSVGRNSVLLLNIPPDNHGRIHSSDVARLMELRKWIDTNFGSNLLKNGNALSAAIIPGAETNTVVLEEDLTKGQRIERFDILVKTDGLWQSVAQGTTVGKKRIMTFPGIKADSLRIDILSSRGEPHLSLSGAYHITMPDENAAAEPTVSYPELAPQADWKTKTRKSSTPALIIDMRKANILTGFIYTPDAADNGNLIFKYRVEVSDNGKKWREVSTIGEFGNIQANPIPQQVIFNEPVKARYFRLHCIERTGTQTATPNFAITLLTAR